MTYDEILRKTYRRLSVSSLGKNPDNPRVTRAQLLMDGQEREIMALPYDLSRYAQIQNADGSFKFMLGISQLGGGDPLSGP